MNINSLKKKNKTTTTNTPFFFFHSFLNHQDPISRLLQHWNRPGVNYKASITITHSTITLLL